MCLKIRVIVSPCLANYFLEWTQDLKIYVSSQRSQVLALLSLFFCLCAWLFTLLSY